LFQAQTFLPIEGSEAIEKQLADISQGDGIAARDAFQGYLLYQGSQKAIDRTGVAEIADAGEKFGGGDFATGLSLEAALSVVGAEVCLDTHDEHAASPALCVDVTAKGGLIFFLLHLGLRVSRGEAGDRRKVGGSIDRRRRREHISEVRGAA
jgi:hypothetical protein